MQRVKLYQEINFGPVSEVVEDFVGIIRSDVSPMGVICVQDYLGKQTVVSLDNYSRMETEPMKDEEILATEGLGEWYQEQIDNAVIAKADPELH